MKINKISDIEAIDVQMEDANNVTKQVLVGPHDGSKNIILRKFKIAPGGNTPYHTHNYEHLVKIEKGKGIAVDKNGEYEVTVGNSLFVIPNEPHQFKNPFDEDFEFLCIIPNPEI